MAVPSVAGLSQRSTAVTSTESEKGDLSGIPGMTPSAKTSTTKFRPYLALPGVQRPDANGMSC